MKENQKKSFDFAADTVKQLIILSTAIITLTVTFSKDIVGISNDYPKILLAWTWGTFIGSLFFGILALMALTGSLQPIKDEKDDKALTTEEKLAAKKKEEENFTVAKNIIADAERNGIILEDVTNANFSINTKSIRIFSALQILSFIAGIVLTVLFGYKLVSRNLQSTHQNDYRLIRRSTIGSDTTIYVDTFYLPRK